MANPPKVRLIQAGPRRMGMRAASVFAVALAATALFPPASPTHSDGSYDQPVWFQWSRSTIDALIFPSDHGQLLNQNGVLGGLDPDELDPCLNSYTRAMNASAQAWKTAINSYGVNWLKNGLTVNIYVIGCGPKPPNSALTNPEILVNSDEDKTVILGVSVSTKPCLVFNSKTFLGDSFTYNDMFSVAGHEFGHCLGLDHVGGEHPDQDILDATYDEPIGLTATPRRCPSNLNVEGLEGVFAAILGQASTLWGKTGTVSTGAYAQIAC